jgi:DNA-binding transcriptional regulator LsrR (DeoR family)
VRTMKQLKQEREQINEAVAKYLFAHRDEAQRSVAERFGMTESTVSRIVKRAGLAPRKPGRKAKEKSTT